MMPFTADTLPGPLAQPFFIKALIASILVALVCGVTGCLVILRKMSFLGDAISHAMIAGVAAGYLTMKLIFGIEAHAPAMLFGALIAAILTVGLIHFVSSVSRIKDDTAIGIMYTGVFALGVVMVSLFREHIHIDLMHFIMGDVLAISDGDILLSALVSAGVLTLILLFFRHFQAAAFDPVMAAAIGIPVGLVHGALTLCVSLVVVVGVGMVGVILVVGLLITPAATAYLLTDRLDRMMLLSALFAASGAVCGLFLAYALDVAGGGAIMLFLTFQFVLVLMVAPQHGILTRYVQKLRHLPQDITEDILADLFRKDPAGIAPAKLLNTAGSRVRLGRALRLLEEEDLIRQDPGSVRLTEKGRKAALKIRRSHRIWESYLAHAGMDEEQIHPKAHELEHMKDPEILRRLDDLLGHPMTDPHGSEIPQDPCLHQAGTLFSASLLRPGQKAILREIPPSLAHQLRPGEGLFLTSRDEMGEIWNFRLDNAAPLALDHGMADALVVEMDADTRRDCENNF
ncbi:iron chelate uptake ABC transporter family permease subunit [Desulfobotulus sp.]|jgi:manganese/iron transport system permease protein/iron/zinc/copper transport system permease protein|uniref:metal ABC transporter permease n=1 Tax=Desulfobotulus sp. TaxID=1940337 RepID=UPI002A370549|nr:iron chelate uptake ABC transporter family permease subunit [Desulfobotulus sp.]MDY0164617.1 iron chelate uptake ABC transporter family permease subunit [Desulfobotulus sp.]